MTSMVDKSSSSLCDQREENLKFKFDKENYSFNFDKKPLTIVIYE